MCKRKSEGLLNAVIKQDFLLTVRFNLSFAYALFIYMQKVCMHEHILFKIAKKELILYRLKKIIFSMFSCIFDTAFYIFLSFYFSVF